MLREAQKISRPLPLISGEVPRFHGGSLWHVSLGIDLNNYRSHPKNGEGNVFSLLVCHKGSTPWPKVLSHVGTPMWPVAGEGIPPY